MVKLTIVGRVRDGLPLSQDHSFVNEEKSAFFFYKQQAEFILREISRGSLLSPKLTILVDHHSFHYLVKKKVCFITLCDSSYPRKLVFHYLQDLQKEFEKFDDSLIEKISKTYSFVKFDGITRNIRKMYIDTRTQANLSKLNANRKQDLDIITEQMHDIIQRRQISETSESRPATQSQSVSSIWTSQRLETIALKWTPVAIIIIVGLVILQGRLILTDDYLISTMI